MLRALAQRLSAGTQYRGYKNFVMNDTLAQLERQCENVCPPPRIPPQKVAVIGAGSDIGRMACLMLKQQKLVKVLAMYDEIPSRRVFGVAHDIAHIDTSTAVEAYQGRPYLPCALYDSDVVLICGGWYSLPPCCNILDRDLFFQNMQFVRTVCISVAHICPKAILCVQTPPVDCNFALCKYTLEGYDVYDRRKLIGVNSINSMRANQLFSAEANVAPDGYVPVICGTGRCTRVPIFSSSKSFYCCPPEKIPCLTRLVREADEIICRVKSNYEQGHLSIGFATARCVVNVMSGLFDKPGFIESALVEQEQPKKCYDMEICATPIMMGPKGISEYRIPGGLTSDEEKLLEDSKCDLEDMLNLGRCYATGDDYYIHPCKVCPCYFPPPPPPCRICGPTEPAPDPDEPKVCEEIIGEPPKEKEKKLKPIVCKEIIGEPKGKPSPPPVPCDEIIGEPQSVRRARICMQMGKPKCKYVIGETAPKAKKK